ncbi:MAG TPA: hypothetical protein PLF63_02520 [Rubrivivax sp.]|nr:hypothetical protein [Rubrivivax sp.]
MRSPVHALTPVATALVASASFVPPAAAQVAAPQDFKVQQIEIAAQHRREKLQELPISATAISTRDIEDRGIESVADLSSIAPNLQVSRTPGNPTAA